MIRSLLKSRRVAAWGILLTAWICGGCGSVDPGAGNSALKPPPRPDLERFANGDTVVVTFSGLATENARAPHEEAVKDDGNITLDLIGPIKAVGKTPGELQNEIQTNYVPRFFTHMTVTVKAKELMYYVSGEVNKKEGRIAYGGETTVLKAIATAGGFTDFANQGKVTLTRSDGTILTVNCKKARTNPKLDLPVFPGDHVYIPRTPW